MSQLPACLAPRDEDLKLMLACTTHLGARNLLHTMEPYVWKRRFDGTNIINLQQTWEKLILAARIIVAIENPHDVCAIAARPYAQRAVLKFAHYTGAQAVTGRFTPGTFTNQIQKQFMEPRVLILADPRIDHQPVRESAYVNIPTIAFCNTDSPVRFVDVVIPCNNKNKNSVALMWWLLAREVLRLRGTIKRSVPWNVMVDMFIYRDPDEEREQQKEQQERAEAAAKAADAPADAAPAAGAATAAAEFHNFNAPTEWN